MTNYNSLIYIIVFVWSSFAAMFFFKWKFFRLFLFAQNMHTKITLSDANEINVEEKEEGKNNNNNKNM